MSALYNSQVHALCVLWIYYKWGQILSLFPWNRIVCNAIYFSNISVLILWLTRIQFWNTVRSLPRSSGKTSALDWRGQISEQEYGEIFCCKCKSNHATEVCCDYSAKPSSLCWFKVKLPVCFLSHCPFFLLIYFMSKYQLLSHL